MAINLQLEAFRAFANSDVSADQAAQMDKGDVTSAKTTASWLSRQLSVTGDAKTAIAENNRVRSALVSALKSQFGVDSFASLPEQVKAALKGTHASSAAGDFALSDAEKALSGRPLTKRRIEAVIRAVERELGDAAADIPVSCRPLTPSKVTMRMNHSQELVDSLMTRFTENVNGEPLVTPRYENLARVAVKAFVEQHLVNMGDGTAKHTFAGLAKQLAGPTCFSWTLSFNWLDTHKRTDEDGTLTGGAAFRYAFVAKALEETLKAYNADHADGQFYDVREATAEEVAAAQQRSAALSLPQADLSEAGKQRMMDVLCCPTDKVFTNPRTTEDSFSATEKDLNRGQLTKLGGETFGKTAQRPWDAAQVQAYRAKVRETFRNDEGLIRLFNGMAAQGFAASLAAGRMVGLDPRHDADQMLLINSPFSNDLEHDMTFEVRPEENGSFTMTYAFHRTGDEAPRLDGDTFPLDHHNTFEDQRAEINFAHVAEGTEGARKLDYTGDDGEKHTLWFTISVTYANARTQFSFLPSEGVLQNG